MPFASDLIGFFLLSHWFMKECAKAHSRAEARLLRQPSLRRVRILVARFYFIGRIFLGNKKTAAPG